MSKENKYISLLLVIFAIINNSNSKEKNYFYKCGVYDENIAPIKAVGIPRNEDDPSFNRRLDSDGFKDLKIYIDLENLKSEIKQNNLTHYQELYINSMNKAVRALEKLLKIKQSIKNFYIKDESLKQNGIEKWETSKFGTEAYTINRTTLTTLGIDLVIFCKISDKDSSNLASAKAILIDDLNRPFGGLVYINKNVVYSRKKSQEYLEAILIHEFTHVLGFSNYFFTEFYHNVFYQLDAYGVNRTYINSSKVLEVAKKYFNCSNIKGVPLEEYGGAGTVGSHWEARVLLGDYMNGYAHTEEQVISEFTLALLEDTGYYKAKYYTGGLMRYGKNKGCSFVTDSCVNKTDHTINPYFENEYYDSINSYSLIDPSCSSGRQSRTYFAWWIYPDLSKDYSYYVYFSNNTYGGFGPADFCPVAQYMSDEESEGFYVGQCNNKGNEGYGESIYYDDGKTFSSGSLSSITGEVYSDHSFCFLSSLFKEETENVEYYSSINRAICYNINCSEKSLTVQIFDDYIVCPRAGGKIEVDGFKGFFLCPDYNLMCSGTVICNDMFECVEKESEVKESSYIYDYEIKTSQNLADAYCQDADVVNNYELSEDGICPIYCKHCKENKKCLKCKDDYVLVGKLDEEKVECLDKNLVNTGYYKSDENIYYQCLENCENCLNSESCEKCMNGYEYINKKCNIPVEKCKEYNNQGICSKCEENYGFKKNDRRECINIESLSNYYSFDNGISYYPCNENITNCKNCFYEMENSKLNCFLCEENYILINSENKCYSKEFIDNNKTIFYINETHSKYCSDEIEYCYECENNEKCIKCQNNFFLVNNDEKKCVEKSKIESIDEYYLNDENTTYYSCNNSLYNSVQNCKKCSKKDSCYYCQDEYTFIDGDKSACIKKEQLEGKYIIDPKDNSNYIKCSNFIDNCDSCTTEKCLLCNEGFIFINDNFNKCLLKDTIEIEFYYTNDNITFYSCKDNKYKNNEKCQEILKTTIIDIPTTQLIQSTKIPSIHIETTIPSTIQNIDTIKTSNIDFTTNNINPPSSINENINITTQNLNKIDTTIIKTPSTSIIITTTIPNIKTTIPSQPILSTDISIIKSSNIIQSTHIETTIPSTIQNINPIKTSNIDLTTNNINSSSSINDNINITTQNLDKIDTTNIKIPSTFIITTTIPNINPIKTSNIDMTTNNINSSSSIYNNINITNQISEKIDTTISASTNTIISSPSTIVNIKATIPSQSKISTSFVDISTTIINDTFHSTFPTIIINNYIPQLNEIIFFILQVKIINRRIMIYIILNFPITKNQIFIFNVKLFLSRYIRNLQNNSSDQVEISFHPEEDYDGNGDKISVFISDIEINENKALVSELKNNKEIKVKLLNDNSEILDTEKVEESIKNGGIDYSEIVEKNENAKVYNVFQYKIVSASTGCEFDLIPENKIKDINQNIELTFIESKSNNSINANCFISNENEGKIICSLTNDIMGQYQLDPFIYSDKNMTFTIIQKNTKDFLSLECVSTFDEYNHSPNKRNKRALSTGGIVAIALVSSIVLITIVSIIIIYRKKSKYNKSIKESNNNIIGATQIYSSSNAKYNDNTSFIKNM